MLPRTAFLSFYTPKQQNRNILINALSLTYHAAAAAAGKVTKRTLFTARYK